MSPLFPPPLPTRSYSAPLLCAPPPRPSSAPLLPRLSRLLVPHSIGSSATRAPSHAADRPSNAAHAPSYAALEQDICWSSEPVVTSSIRPQAATGEAAAAATTGGVVVDGRGCSRCVRGEQCSFHVWVRPPARWVLPPVAPASSEQENGAERGNKGEGESSSGSSMEPSWWKKDVTLSLLGPALGHGEVQCLDPPACSHLRISYRLWDAGTYSATLHVGCANLNFSPAFAAHFNSTYRHDLATWSLSIGWPESVSQKVPGSADAASPSKLPSPCALSSIPGRWTKARSGKYIPPANERLGLCFLLHALLHPWVVAEGTQQQVHVIWAFFPCAPAASPPSRWIEQLASRGIREINIVGDSHQRVLALHLHWLLSGEADKRIRKGHLDFSKESRNERNETMRINFYWVDGIYRNDEFGCRCVWRWVDGRVVSGEGGIGGGMR
ncbi:unnamed protein product [Closterium sp. Naga37s-1]|nr:unnamed protein product [Closterium sp. Naga37s-1]